MLEKHSNGPNIALGGRWRQHRAVGFLLMDGTGTELKRRYKHNEEFSGPQAGLKVREPTRK